MKKILTCIITLLLFLQVSFLYAQEDSNSFKNDTPIAKPRKEHTPLKDKLILGGNMSLGFNPTNINLSPVVGYQVTDNLVLGLGPTYMYTRREVGAGTQYNYSVYGGRLYGRQKAFKNLYAQAEYEVLSVPDYTNTSDPSFRKWISAPLVGTTYVQPIGNRSSIVITLLFNLTIQPITPYTNPIFRIGFNL
jgi:hypothetical protein